MRAQDQRAQRAGQRDADEQLGVARLAGPHALEHELVAAVDELGEHVVVDGEQRGDEEHASSTALAPTDCVATLAGEQQRRAAAAASPTA